jgi:hypothetical protein
MGPLQVTRGEGEGSQLLIKAPDMPLQGFPKRLLKNNASILLELTEGTGSLYSRLECVMKIDERGGELYRTIFSPFE